jgi:hypothetical protein
MSHDGSGILFSKQSNFIIEGDGEFGAAGLWSGHLGARAERDFAVVIGLGNTQILDGQRLALAGIEAVAVGALAATRAGAFKAWREA